MKNYTEIQRGVFQSNNTLPKRTVDDKRIREIIKDKPPQKPPQDRKTAHGQSELARR